MSVDIIAYEIASLVSSRGFLITSGCVIFLIVVAKILSRIEWFLKKRKYPPNTVILHQFPAGYRIPSTSPFVLKLETWLRMTDIKYQNEHGFRFGPKGKLPFITYNGQDVPDSQFCIEFLSKTFNKDLSKRHSAKDLGAARAFLKMIEESLIWVSGLVRFVHEPNPKYIGVHPLFMFYAKVVFKKQAFIQGYGRHTKDEVHSIGKADLKALDLFLEGKRFLLGEEPCNEDAAVFGLMAQFLYTTNGELFEYIKNECPNIMRHTENIKATYWKDWDDRITMKKNQEENKNK